MPEIRYHLYLRSGCSLCEAMLQEIGEFSGELLQQTEIRDVDARTEWQDRFGLLVPVLTNGQGQEICHYFLDIEQLRSSISAT
ncbi:MAG: glutaredoxin family protein [Gammaproteobacteria bacterium]|nr:glutaredoxin family protein [Gammaproteobacteria bacterium]